MSRHPCDKPEGDDERSGSLIVHYFEGNTGKRLACQFSISHEAINCQRRFRLDSLQIDQVDADIVAFQAIPAAYVEEVVRHVHPCLVEVRTLTEEFLPIAHNVSG